MPLRFIHCSDIHLLDLKGAQLGQFLNKRLTGGVNLLLSRGRKHSHNLFDRIIEHAREFAVDRLVITGDLTNLALEPEFALVRGKLEAVGLPVTVIPGNHDTYTRGSARARRFEAFLGEFMVGERDGADYPFVQRLGDVALVGVSTAIPSLPLVAVGRVGDEQLKRLDTMLARLGEEGLARVVLIHHPVLPGVAKPRHDLLDLEAFGRVIASRGAELILHGHEHRRIEGALPGPERPVPVHGVGSGTYLSQLPGKHGAFSLYTVAPGSISRVYHYWNGAAFTPEPAAAY
jgi:3',5'-cyclic AMP phosphodiesterase CpdA